MVSCDPTICIQNGPKKKTGDMMYLEALGNRILVLNSTKAAHDLLEKRATIYSDRPSFTMIGELIGLDKVLHTPRDCNERVN